MDTMDIWLFVEGSMLRATMSRISGGGASQHCTAGGMAAGSDVVAARSDVVSVGKEAIAAKKFFVAAKKFSVAAKKFFVAAKQVSVAAKQVSDVATLSPLLGTEQPRHGKFIRFPRKKMGKNLLFPKKCITFVPE